VGLLAERTRRGRPPRFDRQRQAKKKVDKQKRQRRNTHCPLAYLLIIYKSIY